MKLISSVLLSFGILFLASVSGAGVTLSAAPENSGHARSEQLAIESFETHEIATSPDVYGRLKILSERALTSPASVRPQTILPVGDIVGAVGPLVWQIVVDNKPALQSSVPRVSALPPTVKDWQELGNWRGPLVKTYQVKARSFLGYTAFSFTYAVSANFYGSQDGKGQYLANVTILPIDVSVGWGYTLNSRVETGSPVNLGSQQAPVAGLPVELVYTVSSLFRLTEKRDSYFVTGDGRVLQQ